MNQPAAVKRLSPPITPPPLRDFLIFFPRESASLTERAHQQIQNAERYFDPYRDKYKDLKLLVFGYADASEAGNHFQLAERRAESVADELELKGWTKEAVIVVSCSAGQPLGPNPPESRQVATDRVVTVEIEPQSGRRPKCRPATP